MDFVGQSVPEALPEAAEPEVAELPPLELFPQETSPRAITVARARESSFFMLSCTSFLNLKPFLFIYP